MLRAPTKRIVVILIAVLATACGGTLGPLVTDVRWGDSGDLQVTRCMLDIQGAGNITTYNLHDCKRTTQAGPGASATQMAMPAPSGSNASVVHPN
jgi:hypothetical protein